MHQLVRKKQAVLSSAALDCSDGGCHPRISKQHAAGDRSSPGASHRNSSLQRTIAEIAPVGAVGAAAARDVFAVVPTLAPVVVLMVACRLKEYEHARATHTATVGTRFANV